MNQAIIEAKKALLNKQIPIGAVIVKKNKIIARAHNNNYIDNDPTSHAEINAIRSACRLLSTPRLDDCDLYVTIEPCIMCAAVISKSRISRVYYGAIQEKYGSYESSNFLINNAKNYHIPEIYGLINSEECKKLIIDYFKLRR
jgi:tRNA(adenine34) deaminase|tara:strand:- start:122 stop:550 length:429 start_codon:yes stop_codon:yes gene_type:complete